MNPEAPQPTCVERFPKRPPMRATRRQARLRPRRSTPLRLAWAWACAGFCGLAAANAVAQGSAELGFRLMAAGSAGNCVVCHSMPGASGPPSTFAPALHQVGARYSAQELRQWVTDARVIKSATLMPPFGTTQGTLSPMLAQPLLSFEEISHVVAALQTLR